VAILSIIANSKIGQSDQQHIVGLFYLLSSHGFDSQSKQNSQQHIVGLFLELPKQNLNHPAKQKPKQNYQCYVNHSLTF